MINFSKEQKNKIRSYKNIFSEYSKSEEGKNDIKTRNERVKYYQNDLPHVIDEFLEVDLEKIISELWATRWFGNKQYLTQDIISKNGLEKIQKEFKRLIDTSIPPEKRYKRALKEVGGLGPAYITEMLSYLQPKKCCIWNSKARNGIRILGLDNLINPDKYQLTDSEYADYNEFGKLLLNEIKNMNLAVDYKPMDMLIVDFFLYVVDKLGENAEIIEDGFDHNEIRDLTAEIGLMLGFESTTEFKVAQGSVVDVVWSTEIGNLGSIKYIFEVQKSGSTKGLLFNLLKAKKYPSVQKIIAISDEKQLEKIKNESEGLDEFSHSMAFWNYKDVKKAAENLKTAMEIINDLSLTEK